MESAFKIQYRFLALLMLTVRSGMMENVENVHKELILGQLVSVFLLVITVGLGIIMMDFVSRVIKAMI